MRKNNRRVVITGAFGITSLGIKAEDIIYSFQQEKVLFEPSAYFPEINVQPIMNFDVRKFTARNKDLRYLNRASQFGAASFFGLMQESDISKCMRENAGLFCSCAPNFDITDIFSEIKDGKIAKIPQKALWLLDFLPNTLTSFLARSFDIHGENSTVGTACTASTQAIGEAFRKIREGYLDMAFAGGGDSRLGYEALLAYKMAGVVSHSQGSNFSSSPFDRSHNGITVGEGGAFFILEELEHAKRRRAEILAEITGFGCSLDSSSLAAPALGVKWAFKAIQTALNDSLMKLDEIDIVLAHGTGTVANDIFEVKLLEKYLTQKTKIIALKSWFGHISSACGAVELYVALILLEKQFLPLIRNLSNPISSALNFVRETKEYNFSTMLLQNFGFGGQNASLVIKRYED